ncbi:MAG: hypothetical protein Kow00107_10810 [Planctomycetota bacterium]
MNLLGKEICSYAGTVRRRIQKFSLALVVAVVTSVAMSMGFGMAEDEPARKPNVVLILADDLGYAELGCQGCKDIPTPNIDSIARNGVRFTQGYVTCPICAPTRAGLLTGRYQQRFGFETNPGPEEYAEEDFGLPVDQLTIAERLKPLGYTTGMVGKLHIGYKPEMTPPKRGFDEFFGFLSGAHNFLPGKGKRDLRRGMETVTETYEYLTDKFGSEACAFITKNKDNPFFLYLPFNAVHSPLEATDKYLRRLEGIKDEKRRTYAAMTIAMDDAIGNLLSTLRNEGLEENTLVFFLSDNGGPTPQTTSSNAPLRGYKGQLWEGGIRIPYIVQWKGHLPEGKVYTEPVISLDILPTILAAAGKPIAGDDFCDGVDLLPFLTGEIQGKPHDALYWRFNEQRALRTDKWKLLKQNKNTGWELFNLDDDISESKNLAEQMPEKVKELEALWEKWNSQLQPPKWIRRDSRTGKEGEDLKRKSFEDYDKNGDGKLGPGEIPQQLIDRYDTNGDGFVSREEARAARKGR